MNDRGSALIFAASVAGSAVGPVIIYFRRDFRRRG
jgi:hypothetical protein